MSLPAGYHISEADERGYATLYAPRNTPILANGSDPNSDEGWIEGFEPLPICSYPVRYVAPVTIEHIARLDEKAHRGKGFTDEQRRAFRVRLARALGAREGGG